MSRKGRLRTITHWITCNSLIRKGKNHAATQMSICHTSYHLCTIVHAIRPNGIIAPLDFPAPADPGKMATMSMILGFCGYPVDLLRISCGFAVLHYIIGALPRCGGGGVGPARAVRGRGGPGQNFSNFSEFSYPIEPLPLSSIYPPVTGDPRETSPLPHIAAYLLPFEHVAQSDMRNSAGLAFSP